MWWEAMCGKAGLWGIAGGMVAVAVCGAPAAGQSLQFEPPLYRGSTEGVPLAGQDGWYVPGGGGPNEWRVYRNGGSELGLAPLPAGEGHVAGVTLAAPIGAPQRIEGSADLWTPMVMLMHVVVDFDSSLPAGEEIARMTLEPEGEAASFGWVARRDDGGAETWTFDLIYYTEAGERRQEAFIEGLEAGAWHELAFHLGRTELEIVSVTDTRSWRKVRVVRRSLYAAGGAAGGLPPARSLRFAAGAGESFRSALVSLGVDNVWIADGPPCYQDCDRSGAWDFFDFLCFQQRFAAGDPWADCDGTGSLDFFDFLCFQVHFAGGCGP